MTPQEIAEYKMRWKPGYTVRLHSDVVDRGKTWCRKKLEQHQWSVTTWTDVYEHSFHFEKEEHGHSFEIEFSKFVVYDNTPHLDPNERSWEYDGFGVKRNKIHFSKVIEDKDNES